jgi:nucleoside-diphosphate-sugar epimerase
MHVLITGVGGFIGGRIARAFLAAGWQVTGVRRNRKSSDLMSHPALKIVTTDLRSCNELPGRFDYLVHCAADLPSNCPDGEELYRSNVEGSARIFDLASKAGVDRIVYMSSMSVYGTISDPVVDENTHPHNPDNYGKSKAEGEKLVATWARNSGRAAVSIRLPGIVGAYGRSNFLCETLQKIIADLPVKARNPDALFNNIVYVESLAQFTVNLYKSMPLGHTELTIAANEPQTIRNVIARMYLQAGKSEKIEWAPDTGTSFLISFDRAESLGYKPETVLNYLDLFVQDTFRELATI